MPGSNHDLDPSFMDALPISVRDAGLDLIRFYSLKQMINLRINGVDEYLQNRFKLNEEQWLNVLNAVILTKISYFQIELHFPNRYIDKLIEISSFANGMASKDPIELYHSMLTDHPQFAEWIKNAIQIKQQNLRYQNNLAKST
ncbi:hypothetical protein [Thiomicrorhabdus sp. Kp2]|uniref:hypothetical protein n=1 Tax=Thiomicrorhabdus sp. Kp2 TaxID=1123518 RepID=UPI0003FAE86F|nr:hypothetical protein [Thiomicrorhabdus sp. Kp2]